MTKTTTLHLMVGLPCAGKTTYAKDLEIKENALRFTPDEWHLKLFGQDYHDDAEARRIHDERHTAVEEIMWDTGKRALELGTNVILDYGFWGKSERDFFRAEAKKLGVGFKIHFIDVELDELKSRAKKRNQDGSIAMHFPPEMIDEWSEIFQRPDKIELGCEE